MKHQRCIVTGVTGCVGHSLVHHLLDRDIEIFGIVRPNSNLDKINDIRYHPKFHLMTVDDFNSPFHLLTNLAVDACFHCAGNTNPNATEKEHFADNVTFTETIVELCKHLEIKKLIHVSTAATLGLQGYNYADLMYDFNTDVPSYVTTKRHSEIIVEDSGISHVIIQPCLIIGKYDTNNYAKIVHLINKDKAIGAIPGRINFCDVDNVCEALISAFYRGANGEKYVLAESSMRFEDFFNVIASLLGKKRKYTTLPMWKVRLYVWWCAIKSFFTGKPPEINSSVVKLLCVDAECPTAYKLISRRHLNYPAKTISVTEMVDKWLRHMRETGEL